MAVTHIFVSYSHRDSKWVADSEYDLIPFLSRSLEGRNVEIWIDHALQRMPGADYRRLIKNKINRADFVIMLISQEFVTSKFIREFEIPLIRRRANRADVGLIPILIDHMVWEIADGFDWLLDLNMLPSESDPLIEHVADEVSWHEKRHKILQAITCCIFGDREQQGIERPGITAPPIFGDDGTLRRNAFAFEIGEVLIRAAKCRLLDNRDLIAASDIILGLIRKGSLTRYVLLKNNMDPDKLYKSLLNSLTGSRHSGDQNNKDSPAALSEITDRTELLEKLIINRQDQFDMDAIEVFDHACDLNADRSSSEVSGKDSSVVHELDLLQSLLDLGVWDETANDQLPDSSNVLKELKKRKKEGFFDSDGYLLLSYLDTEAHRLVRTAQAIGQRLGAKPINHRILWVAMVIHPSSYGGALLNKKGVDRKKLCALLLNSIERKSSLSYPLDYEASQYLLLPVIKRARDKNPSEELLTEKDLFYSFIDVAAPSFKSMISKITKSFNLDSLERDN